MAGILGGALELMYICMCESNIYRQDEHHSVYCTNDFTQSSYQTCT